MFYYVILYTTLYYDLLFPEYIAELWNNPKGVFTASTVLLLLFLEFQGARVVSSHLIQLVVLAVRDIEEYWVSPRKDMDQSNVRLQLRVHRTPSTCTTLTAGSPLIFLYIVFIRLLPSSCNIHVYLYIINILIK